MEQTKSFNDTLFQLILERQQLFDTYLLPKLQEEYRISQSAVKTTLTVLVKKGVLHDDPYKYDSKIQDIEIPSDDSFTEGEKAAVVGMRLSQYEAMLDFLHNYYQFTCDFLTTDRINRLVGLGRAFAWEAFSPNSTRPSTKGLADLIQTLRSGGDQLSISILNDALTQLSKSSISITKTLKGLAEFHRERYKVAFRKLVLASVSASPERYASAPHEVMKDVKRAFADGMKGQPFYTELVEEVLREEFSPDHAVLQQELIARLSASLGSGGRGAANIESLKPVLLDGIRTLGAAAPQLEQVIAKIQENHRLEMSVDKGFFERLAALIRKAFSIPERESELVINTLDPATQTTKHESIVYAPFVEDIRKRSRVLTGFAVRGSPTYQRVEAMEEQQILDLLTRHVAEISNLIKQLAGVDEYYKQTLPPGAREQVRGIKVELSAIKNNLVKANQCRAEYSSQVEEIQQLKKLGITNA